MCKDERTHYACGHEYLKTIRDCGNLHCGLRDKFSHLEVVKECRCGPCISEEERLKQTMPGNINDISNKVDLLLKACNDKHSAKLVITTLSQSQIHCDLGESEVQRLDLPEVGQIWRSYLGIVACLGLKAPVASGLQKLEEELKKQSASHESQINSLLEKKQLGTMDSEELRKVLSKYYQNEEEFRSNKFGLVESEIVKGCEKRILALLVVGLALYVGVCLVRGLLERHMTGIAYRAH